MIGGNTVAEIQKYEIKKNRIGEKERMWTTAMKLTGFLDLLSAPGQVSDMQARIYEATHVFIADYQQIPFKKKEIRLRIDDKAFEVLQLDDPMGIHQHLEIYLKEVE